MSSYDDHTSSQSRTRPSAGNRTAVSARVKYEPHPGAEDAEIPGLPEAEAVIRRLNGELTRMEARLLATTQELVAANEQVAAINQKLTAAAEALEASKEELQQANEELLGINGDLERKLNKINGINADLMDLMNATEIGTIVLDGQLCMKRFTPPAEALFGIVAADVGRPLDQLTLRLSSDAVFDDAARVLRDGMAIDRRVQHTTSQQWFLARFRRYHSVVEDGGVVITFVDITEGKRNDEQLEALIGTLKEMVARRVEKIKQLTSELILSEQAERQRIAQILHDDLQQLLIAFQMRVTTLSRSLSDEQTARLAEANTLIAQALNVTQTLTVELSPPVLMGEDADITATLDWLVLRMAHMHKLRVEVASTCPVRVPAHVNMLVYQLVRELLFNIVKHAGVDRASVKFAREEDQLVLLVEDEGAGFDPAARQEQRPATQGGFGLNSVRQRLSLLGGRLEVDAAPGRGTRMTVSVPLKREGVDADTTRSPDPTR